MKKNYRSLLFGTALAIGLTGHSQVSNYSFSQFAGTYAAVTGGTVFGSTTSDDQVFIDPAAPLGVASGATGPGIPIGFNFTFNATVYDRIGISNNGWIMFGLSSLGAGAINSNTSSNYTGISATSTAPGNLQNRVAGLARDLQGQAGSSLRVEVLGTAPNRICVIQWTTYRKFGATGDDFNFQIRLYETTNVVETQYGTFVSNATAANPEIGLRGNSNADFNNRKVTTAQTWATSIAGTVNTDNVLLNNTGLIPASGQVYRWSPPPPCSGAPATNTVVGNINLVCPGGASTLNLASTYTTTGISYLWYASTSSAVGPFTAVPTATGTSYIPTNIQANTWYQAVITCSNGPASSTTSAFNVNIVGTTTNSVPYYEGFEGISINNQLPNCSWAASNLPTINQTYTTAAANNRIPHTGNKFASFRQGTNASGDYFYSNGIQLEPGITYSAAAWYITDGNVGWSNFSLLYGSAQTSAGLTSIASVTGAVTGQFYQLLSGTFNVTTSGLYYIAVKAIGNATPQFLSWDDLSVTIPCSLNSPTLILGIPLNACVGQPVNVSVSGADSYTWSNGSNSSNTSYIFGGSGSVSVMGTSSLSGCASTVSQFISPNPSPVVSVFSNPQTVCAGKTATLTAVGANVYSWNTGSNGPVNTVSPVTPTTYSVIGVNSFGCATTETVSVGVNAAPSVSAAVSSSVLCEGESLTLTGSGAITYIWKAPTLYTETNPVTFVPNASASYTVVGTDVNGCQGTALANVALDACNGITGYNKAGLQVEIYPNPTNGLITIRTQAPLKSVILTDVSGRTIVAMEGVNGAETLDLGNFSAGIYYLAITSGNGIEYTKIIKN